MICQHFIVSGCHFIVMSARIMPFVMAMKASAYRSKTGGYWDVFIQLAPYKLSKLAAYIVAALIRVEHDISWSLKRHRLTGCLVRTTLPNQSVYVKINPSQYYSNGISGSLPQSDQEPG